MTIEVIRTTGLDPRSLALRTAMDDETFGLYAEGFAAMEPVLRERVNAALHTDQADLVEVVIATEDGADLGHAALRALAAGGVEVKKVYVRPEARGRGLSRMLMAAVEDIARELGETRIVLQTGPKQLEAIALYSAIGYSDIPEFGPYVGLSDMVFMGKEL
jgi:GNAT superfamily N-acetyltransferase